MQEQSPNSAQKLLQMQRWQKLMLVRLRSFGDLLSGLESAIDELQTTLGSEYEAISAHSIRQLEAVGKTKAKHTARCEQLLGNLMAATQEFTTTACEQWPEASGLSPSLTTLKTLSSQLAQQWPRGGAQTWAEVDALSRRLNQHIDRCQHKFSLMKLELEKNRFILDRLLYNHQQSYHFWQTSMAEASSSYDRSGHRRSPGVISQFSTKV